MKERVETGDLAQPLLAMLIAQQFFARITSVCEHRLLEHAAKARTIFVRFDATGLPRLISRNAIDEPQARVDPDAAEPERLAHTDPVATSVGQLKRVENGTQLEVGQVLESDPPTKPDSRFDRLHDCVLRILGILRAKIPKQLIVILGDFDLGDTLISSPSMPV
jgi:hypothetical protein